METVGERLHQAFAVQEATSILLLLAVPDRR
jgi:hypothetical protein